MDPCRTNLKYPSNKENRKKVTVSSFRASVETKDRTGNTDYLIYIIAQRYWTRSGIKIVVRWYEYELHDDIIAPLNHMHKILLLDHGEAEIKITIIP